MKIDQKYTCRQCGTGHTIALPQDGIDLYLAGAHVQDAFPMLSPEERELMISGICGPCFDGIFPEEEEDDWFEFDWPDMANPSGDSAPF